MKILVAAILFVASIAVASGQGQQQKPPVDDAAKLRQQITEIRRATDWDDEKAAEKANQQILELTKRLMQLQTRQANAERIGATDTSPKTISVPGGATITTKIPYDEVPQPSFEMAYEVLKAAGTAQDEKIEFDAAKPVREQIEKEYEEERKELVKNPAYFDELQVLIIDFSIRESRAMVDLLPRFTRVHTLVLKGGAAGYPVNLKDVLTKASKLPLENLLIIGFRSFVKQIPDEAARFPKLVSLTLAGNALTAVPSFVSGMTGLKILYVDRNPIATVLPAVAKLTELSELGIAQTGVTPDEQQQLAAALPRCKVLTK